MSMAVASTDTNMSMLTGNSLQISNTIAQVQAQLQTYEQQYVASSDEQEKEQLQVKIDNLNQRLDQLQQQLDKISREELAKEMKKLEEKMEHSDDPLSSVAATLEISDPGLALLKASEEANKKFEEDKNKDEEDKEAQKDKGKAVIQ